MSIGVNENGHPLSRGKKAFMFIWMLMQFYHNFAGCPSYHHVSKGIEVAIE
jgi:hypothetical protein